MRDRSYVLWRWRCLVHSWSGESRRSRWVLRQTINLPMNFAPDFSTKSGKCGPGLNSPRLPYPKRKGSWQSQAPTTSGNRQAFDSWPTASRPSPKLVNFGVTSCNLPCHARQGDCCGSDGSAAPSIVKPIAVPCFVISCCPVNSVSSA